MTTTPAFLSGCRECDRGRGGVGFFFMIMKLQIPKLVESALACQSPVAIGVSGGKDSCAVGIAVAEHINGYDGPKILIHSDLGSVEWKDSLPTCQRLADRIGWELVVVRRAAGGMMERWEQRWYNNCQRYLDLLCVKLILPWSTPSMRFCTSELKSAVIASELKKRFGGGHRPCRPILSVTGIRAAESANRAKSPVVKENPRLVRGDGTFGFDWNAIHGWSTPFIYEYLAMQGFDLHEAYRVFGSTRVSCCFCIMGSQDDLQAASQCVDNAEIYVRMCDLEIDSTFSFQSKWLSDVAPHLLRQDQRDRLPLAKAASKQRQELEKRIPKSLEYEKGWPKFVPTLDQCGLIADVRIGVSRLINLKSNYLTAESVQARYQQLFNDRPR